jgi:hypothetical protein
VAQRLAGRGGEEALCCNLLLLPPLVVFDVWLVPVFSVLAPWWRAGVGEAGLLPRVCQLKGASPRRLWRQAPSPRPESMDVGHPLPPLLLAEPVSLHLLLPKWPVPRWSCGGQSSAAASVAWSWARDLIAFCLEYRVFLALLQGLLCNLFSLQGPLCICVTDKANEKHLRGPSRPLSWSKKKISIKGTVRPAGCCQPGHGPNSKCI